MVRKLEIYSRRSGVWRNFWVKWDTFCFWEKKRIILWNWTLLSMLYAVNECRHYDIWRRQDHQYLAVIANCEKRLSASSCPSVRPHATNPLPLDGLLWNSTFEYFFRNPLKNQSLFKIWQEELSLYVRFVQYVARIFYSEKCFKQALFGKSQPIC